MICIYLMSLLFHTVILDDCFGHSSWNNILVLVRNELKETITAAVAEWLRAWDTLTMFEATVCGRS